jgi:hypothetical protein
MSTVTPANNARPTTPPAPAAPAGGPPAARFDVRVTVANLRNGDVADIVSAAPRSSIPVAYKWVHIQGMSSDEYVTYVDHVIRATYAQVLTMYSATPADTERRNARMAAIVLGSVRSGAAAALKLTPQDLAATETAGSGSTLANGVVSAGNGTAGGRFAVAVGMDPLSTLEVSIVNTLMYLGMSVPVLQGVSLMLSGHHFLPTTRNVFMGMKKQATQASGGDVIQWVDSLGDAFDDYAFHKACHPILMNLKRGWAKQDAMAAKLKNSGHGAAAIRLPAIPSDAHAGKASLAIVVRARPVIVSMGHTCEFSRVKALIRSVEVAPAGKDESDAVNVLRQWYEESKPIIAFCAGIVAAVRDSAGGSQDTTLRAYSVRKAISDHPSEHASGTNYARASLAKQREAAMTGTFADPVIRL